MKRKHNLYSRPKKPFDKNRIEEEAKIQKEYGLKNKKEIWKTEAKIKLIREKAKKLIKESPEEQNAFFKRLKEKGFNVNSISDALALGAKDYLEKRLQTIIFKKNLVNSTREARQKIAHKKVLVNGKIVNKPSYIVPINYLDKIVLKDKKVTKKKEIHKSEISQIEQSEEIKKEEIAQKEVMETEAESKGN